MHIQILVHAGLLCIVEILKLFILTVLELTMFLKKLKTLLDIKASVFRVQTSDSIMCVDSLIGFIHFMLEGKTLIDYTSLFSPNDFEKNGNIVFHYFKNE